MKIALIGYGAIGKAFARGLKAGPDRLVGILSREASAEAVRRQSNGVPVFTCLDDLLAASPDVVVESAGHAALHAYGATVLRRGTHLVIASIGALADHGLEAALREAASPGSRLVIPSGALGGLDALGAARLAGLDSVDYVSRKAPAAWKGTKAERLVDLAGISEAQVFYEGAARQATLDFPQNANVVAAVALAGIGFERTRVRLMVDPHATCNRHTLEARGAFGELSATVLAQTFPENPKTSILTSYSLLRAVENLGGAVVV
jgi:aspartate dehydrogenase